MAKRDQAWLAALEPIKLAWARKIFSEGTNEQKMIILARGISDKLQNDVQQEKPTDKVGWLKAYAFDDLFKARRVTKEVLDEIFTEALINGRWENGQDVARSFRAMKAEEKKAFLEKEELL